MKTHKFTLILSGVSEITAELAHSLYAATRGDIELQMCNGIPSLDFERPGQTLRVAIWSAIRDVEQAGVRVVRVESASANAIAKINAELLGEIRQVAKRK